MRLQVIGNIIFVNIAKYCWVTFNTIEFTIFETLSVLLESTNLISTTKMMA